MSTMTYEQIVNQLSQNASQEAIDKMRAQMKHSDLSASPASPPAPKPHVLPKVSTESVVGPLAASVFAVALILGIANAAK